jgi:RNA polymerase sigma factor (sigma-70 family)
MTPDGDDGRQAGLTGIGIGLPAEGGTGTFLQRLRILDDEAFTRELEACEAKVRRSIGGFIHDRDVAADIFAETVATAYRRRYKFLVGGGSFRAWIDKIAHNKVREHFRRQRSLREVALPETSQVHQDSLSQEEALVAQEDAAQLALSFGKLDADQQTMLRLFYRDGRSIRSIAEELGLKEAAVKKRLSRGRQQLRDQLLQEDVYRDLSAEGKQAVADFLSEDQECRGDIASDMREEG